MAEIIARFADGRLLVQEERTLETDYRDAGAQSVRIGHVKTVEKILSIDAFMSGYHGEDGRVGVELGECLVSGDTLVIRLRRLDLPLILSGNLSGTISYGVLSGTTSGRGYMEELLSGVITSGRLKVLTNVIGF